MKRWTGGEKQRVKKKKRNSRKTRARIDLQLECAQPAGHIQDRRKVRKKWGRESGLDLLSLETYRFQTPSPPQDIWKEKPPEELMPQNFSQNDAQDASLQNNPSESPQVMTFPFEEHVEMAQAKEQLSQPDDDGLNLFEPMQQQEFERRPSPSREQRD